MNTDMGFRYSNLKIKVFGLFNSLFFSSCSLYIGLTIEIDNKTVVFDVSLICGSFDAPAKAAVQNIITV